MAEVEAGTRVDVLLVRRIDGMSRARARRMIQDGEVRVNGRRVRKGARLSPGDAVELDALPPPADFVPEPAPDLPLVVLYEDDALVIVDKPAGQPTHPLRPHHRDTTANALIARYPEMAGVGYALREPGILHRLDNDTSGVLLAARHVAAFDALRVALTSGGIDKRYLLLVAGAYEGPAEVDHPIAPHPSDPRRVHVCVEDDDRALPRARAAETFVRAIREAAGHSLLEARVAAAVRHQIRAHLAALGHPLCGDWLYGGPTLTGLDRHFLHASRIGFDHPETGERVDVESPLPRDLAALLTQA